VGRIDPLKGIDKLIQAIPYLQNIQGLKLVVIGGGENSQREIEQLQKLACNLNIQDSVTFLGLIKHEQLPYFYSAADVCVVPSYYESFGLVALESVAVHDAMDIFLKMFTESRQDKATFLTAQMESFLRSLANSMTEAGLLRLGILELDMLPTAMIMCFDYNDCLYLYNSGYDPQYNTLSAGLLCKVLCIKESIQEGKKRVDFLKGSETYKYHLGGREVPLYRCQITIK